MEQKTGHAKGKTGLAGVFGGWCQKMADRIVPASQRFLSVAAGA